MDNQPNNQPKQDDRFQKINGLILNNEDFLIVVNANDFDSVAAATGLGLLLESLEKKVTLYAEKPIKAANFPDLNGVDKFVSKIDDDSNKMLITFNCPLSSIERVSSVDEGEKLTLVTEFKPGVDPVDPSEVEIKQARPNFSAGFVLDTQFAGENDLTKRGQWVWVSKTGQQRNWAYEAIVEKQATISESIVSVVSRSGYQLPVTAVMNFYQGIKKGTNSFENADSIALETAAFCLRLKEEVEKRNKQGGQPIKTEAPPVEQVEKKEADMTGQMGKPPIFTGTTTPKV